MLETTLKQSSPQNLDRIGKNLLSFGTRANLEGFFAELFIMRRLISKNVEYEYTPNTQGVDFVLPALGNLNIEVTSRQAESWDGRSEAMTRWEECLPIFKTGLLLLLIDAKDIAKLSNADWLDGFEYFENYVQERMGSIQIDDRILPRNNNGVVLADISVEGIDNDSQKPTVVKIQPQVSAPDPNDEARKFLLMIVTKIKEKALKSQSKSCILTIDLTHESWLNDFALSMRKQIIRKHLETELTKHPQFIHLVLFKRYINDMNLSLFLSIPNVDSTLAKSNHELYEKALEIFQ